MLLKHQRLAWIGGFFALSLVGGCVTDLGTLDDSDPDALDDALGVGLRDPIDPFPPIPPDPFQVGDERLYVGLFYEGGYSEEILINTSTTDYFVFAVDEREPVKTRSFAEGVSRDRVEGRFSYEITLINPPAPGCGVPPGQSCWWGGGILWFEPFDLRGWTTMFVSLKSSDPSFETFEITLQYGDAIDAQGNELEVMGIFPPLDPTDYGYVNDGEWYFLEIPLQDAIDRGWDPSKARSPFIVGGAPGGQPGDVLLIDNLYFTKD